jgi:CIC family chloride channel protein
MARATRMAGISRAHRCGSARGRIDAVFVPAFAWQRGKSNQSGVYIFDGYLPFRTVIGKFVCCALAIGSGHSLGPRIHPCSMGAGIASLLGRRIRLSQEKLRLIAPVRAAAGLAAAFNAPIAAVLFVIEEVIGA